MLTVIGGLALFLYGMYLMSEGLSMVSGKRLERILARLTDSPAGAVLCGAGVTALIQSSSATTVMVVGFVNSGIMGLEQAAGIIMGANVGTTVTAWILGLVGMESSSVLLWIMKPTSFSPVLALVGVVILLSAKQDQYKNIASVPVGFFMLMFGMETMSNGVKPLVSVPEFTGIITSFSHPLTGLLAGLTLTAALQSSSASVGILQALCATGAVSYGTAVPIILGQNIGTCVTAILSAVGAGRNARRAALIHLYFNMIGTGIFLIGFYAVHAIVPFKFFTKAADGFGIALLHSAFNIAALIVLFPFSHSLVKLACLTVPGEEEASVNRGGTPHWVRE